MSAAVTIVMSGDDTRLQAAHNRLFAAQEKALENFQKSVNKSKEAQAQAGADLAARKAVAEAEKAKLDIIAKGQKLIEGQMSAQERYNASLAEAEALYKAGAIGADDLARRVDVLNKRLHEESGEAARVKQMTVQATEAHMKAAEVLKSIQTPLEKYNAKLKELETLEKSGALTTDQFAKAQAHAKVELDKANAELKTKNSLLSKAGDGIGTYVTGLASAGTAAAVLRGLWQQIREEQEAGFNALKSTEGSNQALAQIAENPEDYRQMQGLRDSLSMETGVDRNVVSDTLFSARSENFMDALPDLIKSAQVIKPEQSKIVAGKMPAIFNDQIGSLEAVSMTLAAAKKSNLNFEDIAKALPSAAQGGSIAKASPEETTAALSVLAARFGSAEEAATSIKSFSTVAGIDAGGMTEEQRKTAEDRVTAAKKELRRKEETVADIQEKIAAKPTKEKLPALEKSLSRAQRDVTEFDRTRLEMPKEREEFKGLGIAKVVKRLDEMNEGDRQKFLGTSQELNIAYNVLSEERAAIETRAGELAEERADFKKGGGMLRKQVAITQGNADDTAIRKREMSARKLEITQAKETGIEGATAKGAADDATETLLRQKDNLAVRTLGKGVELLVVGQVGAIPAATAVGSQLGLSQETSAGAAVGFTRGLFGGLTGQYGPSIQQVASANAASPQPVVLDASGLKEAASEMKEAAKLNLEAAKLNASQPPQSISGAARAQAATAR